MKDGKAHYRDNRNGKPRLPLALAFIFFLLPLSAEAYLDPTTGSMLISAIVGLFASLVLAIKTYWYRIKSFFKGKPGAPENEDEAG